MMKPATTAAAVHWLTAFKTNVFPSSSHIGGKYSTKKIDNSQLNKCKIQYHTNFMIEYMIDVNVLYSIKVW